MIFLVALVNFFLLAYIIHELIFPNTVFILLLSFMIFSVFIVTLSRILFICVLTNFNAAYFYVSTLSGIDLNSSMIGVFSNFSPRLYLSLYRFILLLFFMEMHSPYERFSYVNKINMKYVGDKLNSAFLLFVFKLKQA